MRATTLLLSASLVTFLAACKDKGGDDGGEITDSGSGDIGDGGADSGSTGVDADGDGYTADEDCDDSDPDVSPGGKEACDGKDNDCDGEVDEADAYDAATWYEDGDGDGWGGEGTTTACDQPDGYVEDGGDCDDDDVAYNPGAAEDDCTDPNDYNCDGSVGYADADGDGFAACEECDDNNADVNPDALEVCNDIDDDCDGTVDIGADDASTWYADTDSDEYGDPTVSQEACDEPFGYVADNTDCDDTDVDVNPAATEVCNDIDDDCDTLIDDADDSVDLSTGTSYYADTDSDTYGDPDAEVRACDMPDGYVEDNTDCDDDAIAVNPGADEVCNDIDDDCDTLVDDDDDSVDLSTGTSFYADTDSDTYGDPDAEVRACDMPDGYVEDDSDCDDDAAAVNPAATEICNDIDDDCDSLTDDDDDSLDLSTAGTWYADTDSDDYGDPDVSVTTCDMPDGYVTDDTDCDDDRGATNPGADEYCNDIDDDCDTDIDEEAVDGDYLADDNDSDGYGDPGSTEWQCDGVDNELDCDDTDDGEPIVVDASTGSSSGTGTMDSPLDTIQAGIDAANECVVVHAGTYYEAVDFSGKDIEVNGLDGSAETIIDATGLGEPAVTFASGESATALLNGFTLTGGEGYEEVSSESYSCTSVTTCTNYYYTYTGGGLYISGADPMLSDLVIADNMLPEYETYTSGDDTYYIASYGGGVGILDGNPIFEQVEVSENYADQGGGFYIDETSTVDVWGAWLGANEATDGAGVQVDGGSLSLENVASLWNTASDDAGGALVASGSFTGMNVTSAGDDGATAGGLYGSGTSDLTLMNSIISYSPTGAGVVVDASATFDGTYNNVYGNTGGEYSGVTDPTGSSGNLSENPDFVSLSDDGDWTNDDVSLDVGSPSIDAGNPDTAFNDADGTANDQGAFGGPGSTWAD